MNTKTVKLLASWIEYLINEANNDSSFSVAQFQGTTDDSPFVIAGGWSEGFSEEYSDLLFISKSEPKYAMCVKIAFREDLSNYNCTDFDLLKMPTYNHGEVDDTCVALEREESPEAAALFYLNEFERITNGYKAGLYKLN